MEENKNSKEDLITLRNYTLGVVGFATAVATVLIQVLHFRTEPTVACTLAFACMMLLIVYLIGRAEKRNSDRLSKHIAEGDKALNGIQESLNDIKASTLRTEMNNEIYRNPQNHDTIIRMAEKYFGKKEDGGLGANWVEKELFLTWVDEEKAKGREVHIPKALVTQLENE